MAAERLSPVYTAHGDARPSRGGPASLDELIGETQRLLADFRALGPAELRTLAKETRILTNYAEAWARRNGAD